MRRTLGKFPGHRRCDELDVVHLPLESTGQQRRAVRIVQGVIDRARRLRRTYREQNPPPVRRTWRRRWMLLGDVNMEPAAAAKALRAPHHAGKKPMTAIWSRGWGQVKDDTRGGVVGTDHVVVELRVGGRS